MARNSNTDNYELILKIKAKMEKMIIGLDFSQAKAKLERFLNKIKTHVDKEVYDLLFCVQTRQLMRVIW
jgi:hypothetical protein